MFKSIFARYYTATAFTIISCFTILGVALIVMTAQYSIGQQQTTLYNNAKDLSEIVSNVLTEPLDDYAEDNETEHRDIRMLNDIISLISENGTKDVIIVDAQGDDGIWLSKEKTEYFNELVDDKVISTIDTMGIYRSNSTLYGIFTENRYTVGLPVMQSYGSSNVTIGYVFVSSPATALVTTMVVVSRYFLLSVCGVLIISMLLIYVASKELVRPMREMRIALSEYSQGNFTKRVHVTGRNEMSELCNSFNQMADALDQLENSRRGFMANISHDLKTPLTSICGFIDGILDGTVPADRQKEYLARVSNETKRLSRLVNSILDVTRLEAGQVSPKKTVFNLNKTIMQVLLSFEKVIDDKNIELGICFDFDKKINVYADEDMISRVLVNIIGNSTKFTPQCGWIRVNVIKDKKNAVVEISNSGKGIAIEDVPFIFDRFYKSDKSRGIDKAGTGLGLYIAKMLVNLNNGEISVNSIPDNSTTFSFTLELGAEEIVSKYDYRQRKSITTDKGE